MSLPVSRSLTAFCKWKKIIIVYSKYKFKKGSTKESPFPPSEVEIKIPKSHCMALSVFQVIEVERRVIQCCGSGMFIPDPDPGLNGLDPGSRKNLSWIPRPKQHRIPDSGQQHWCVCTRLELVSSVYITVNRNVYSTTTICESPTHKNLVQRRPLLYPYSILLVKNFESRRLRKLTLWMNMKQTGPLDWKMPRRLL